MVASALPAMHRSQVTENINVLPDQHRHITALLAATNYCPLTILHAFMQEVRVLGCSKAKGTFSKKLKDLEKLRAPIKLCDRSVLAGRP